MLKGALYHEKSTFYNHLKVASVVILVLALKAITDSTKQTPRSPSSPFPNNTSSSENQTDAEKHIVDNSFKYDLNLEYNSVSHNTFEDSAPCTQPIGEQ